MPDAARPDPGFAAGGTPHADRPHHRRWLLAQAGRLWDFFGATSINRDGGFHALAADGTPIAGSPREVFSTCRMVHCFAAGMVLGHPGAADVVDHGMDWLQRGHRDARHGGYVWGIGPDGAVSRGDKLAYGHAFVLLAAASAQEVGHPAARALHEDVFEVIRTRFWEDGPGAVSDEFRQDWSVFSAYRGQNSNMHMTEALMAAFEAWGDADCLTMAERIAARIINDNARAAGWVVPEHYRADWSVDRDYAGDPMFRPAGTTPGHALEWSRLLIQLWLLGGRRHDWMPQAARGLFLTAVSGWAAPYGGFHYTLGWDGQPAMRNRLWWPVTEAAAAAHCLRASLDDPELEIWYRRIWGVLARDFIDAAHGGWWAEVDADGRPVETVFVGKPDIYHALGACLIPLLPPDRGLLPGLAHGGPL